MSDKADKKKPTAERIAAMFGSTSFRDGFGGISGIVGMPNEEIIRALGWVQQTMGKTPVQCMETFYGQTLTHSADLRQAFEAALAPATDIQNKIIQRVSAELAVRSLAGMVYNTTDFHAWGILLCCRYERVQYAVRLAESWYSEQLNNGLSEFKRRLQNPEAVSAA